MEDTGTRDIIVLGASLGGVEALRALAGQLPADLPAAVLIVQHTADSSEGLLPSILASAGRLPAMAARDGMPLRHGCIVVAPPDRHLLLTPRGLRVTFGPRENRVRPAIDPLFRTAAVHCRSRVVGVILTGLLSDGSAGLLAVERCGGYAVVQAPDDAAHPEMPRNALKYVETAHQVRLEDLGALLVSLVHERAPEPPPVPEALRIEVKLTERAMKDDDWNRVPGRSTDFTCPDCGGALREVGNGGMHRYRCRVGHAYSSEALMAAKDESVEEVLWVALQTLEERGQMLGEMARHERDRARPRNAASLEERASETRSHTERLRDFIQRLASS